MISEKYHIPKTRQGSLVPGNLSRVGLSYVGETCPSRCLSPAEQIESEEITERLIDSLRGKDWRLATVAQEKFLNRRTQKEIAKMLNLPHYSVRYLIRKAIGKMNYAYRDLVRGL
jgi:RNA polymerase sigma factor (sigma-70 family)